MKLHQGSCLDIMPSFGKETIDLTVTSPPYDNMRSYNDGLEWNEDVWKPIFEELYRITKGGGVVVWVVGDATTKGSETGTSFKQALWAMECGFNLHDTMIYEKAQACFGSNLCYLQSFEYMFVFSKGKPSAINFIRDRPNVRGGKNESTVSSGMNKDGVSGKRIRNTADVLGKRKNIWKYGVGGGKSGHPAVFPLSLAEDHIVSWSNEGDVVFDPFVGSGTTGIAAVSKGRSFIGIEKDQKYFDMASASIGDAMMRNQLKKEE